jgi:hypothetical protein
LILFPLYPFIQKYMQPKQEHIQNLTTWISAITSQILRISWPF